MIPKAQPPAGFNDDQLERALAAKRFETVDELADGVEGDSALAERIKRDPAQALREVALPTALDQDVWVYRITVSTLGALAVLALGAILWITLNDSASTVPDGIVALGSAAVGALAGLIAPATRR